MSIMANTNASIMALGRSCSILALTVAANVISYNRQHLGYNLVSSVIKCLAGSVCVAEMCGYLSMAVIYVSSVMC